MMGPAIEGEPFVLHIAPALRVGDPVVLICSGCAQVLVPRCDELAPRCSTCAAELCSLCEGILAAARIFGRTVRRRGEVFVETVPRTAAKEPG